MILLHDSDVYEIGVDEVGRGCLFGDVVAGAVILPLDLGNHREWNDVRDSKKISEKKRTLLDEFIRRESVAFGVGVVDHEEIDRINILNASMHAMKIAIDGAIAMFKQTVADGAFVSLIRVDGDRFNHVYIDQESETHIPHVCIPKGDDKHKNIAAASILAKVYRDNQLVLGCAENPLWNRYDLCKNKGYGTRAHIDALRIYGPIPGHRTTFKPVAGLL